MTVTAAQHVVVATKPLKWKGKQYKPGQRLRPQPEGPERARLISGRFVTLVQSKED